MNKAFPTPEESNVQFDNFCSETRSLRNRLPNRRESDIISFRWKDETYHVSFTIIRGHAYEVFAHGPKAGTDLDAILASVCSTISIALQSGASLEEMEKAALKLSDGEPADIVAKLLLELVNAENSV